jgi:hypothetical protein
MVLALGVHLAFASWIQPRGARPKLQKTPLPNLSFWSQTPGESRALYSPVLFALPTPMGFSASLLNQSLHSDPPIQEHADIRSMLQVDERLAVSPPAEVFPSARFRVEDAMKKIPGTPRGPQEGLAASVPTGGLSIRLDGSSDFLARAPASISDLPDAGPRPWLAAFHVDLYEDARAQRVLLVTRPGQGPERDALIRWVYQQAFQAGVPASGTVVLRWTPEAGAAAP